MKRMLAGALTVGVGALVALTSNAMLVDGQEVGTTVFTTEQADAGRVAYAKNCAACHMPDLSGDNEKPPLDPADAEGVLGRQNPNVMAPQDVAKT